MSDFENMTPPEQPTPRRRRTQIHAAEYAETQTIDLPETKPSMATRPVETTPPAAEIPMPMPTQNTVQSPYVPRPRALEKIDAETRKQQVVRHPVEAPGYSRREPLGARPAKVEQKAARPVKPAVRKPQTQEKATYRPVEEEKPQMMPRWLLVAIIVVLAVAMLVVGFLLIPEEGTSPISTFKRNLLGHNETETEAAASVLDFTCLNNEGTAPITVSFNVTTTGADDVRLVADTGEVMNALVQRLVENTESTIWMVNLTLNESYVGAVSAQIHADGEWIESGHKVPLEIGVPNMTAIPTAAPTPVPMPSVAEAPLEPEADDTFPVPGDVTGMKEDELLIDDTDEDVFLPDDSEDDTLYSDFVDEDDPSQWMDDEDEEDVFFPMDDEDETFEATVPGADEEPVEAVTAEPTAKPEVTATPVPAATEAPAAQVAEATAEPAAAEEAPADATKAPVIIAVADESADPALVSETVRYNTSTKQIENYNREIQDVISMGSADHYSVTKPNGMPMGIMTFRGSSFRQNAAIGTVDNPTSMNIKWQAKASSVKGAGNNTVYYGIGYGSQPVIVQWATETRNFSNMNEEKKNTTALKEVIVAGDDGNIYFLDLNDGKETRPAIKLGYPMRCTPSVSASGHPLMVVGQYARKMASGQGKIGLRFYDLLTQKQINMIDGLDGSAKRPYNEIGSFETSSLFDATSDSLISLGTSGLLYLTKLDTVFNANTGAISIAPSTVAMKSRTKEQALKGNAKFTAVESSFAAYGSYIFYADIQGILRCVDTSSMETVWAQNTGDCVEAAIALDLDADGKVWLYTANELKNRAKGDCTIRRYNALTGREDWAVTVGVEKNKKQTALIPGARASAVVGRNELNDMVYYVINGVSAVGAETLKQESAASAMLVAMNKATGKTEWSAPLGSYTDASPVAVYDTEGNGWILTCASNGVLTLFDGMSGQELNTLKIDGTILGSPAVYNNTLVIGTTGRGSSYIYGISLE